MHNILELLYAFNLDLITPFFFFLPNGYEHFYELEENKNACIPHDTQLFFIMHHNINYVRKVNKFKKIRETVN